MGIATEPIHPPQKPSFGNSIMRDRISKLTEKHIEYSALDVCVAPGEFGLAEKLLSAEVHFALVKPQPRSFDWLDSESGGLEGD